MTNCQPVNENVNIAKLINIVDEGSPMYKIKKDFEDLHGIHVAKLETYYKLVLLQGFETQR